MSNTTPKVTKSNFKQKKVSAVTSNLFKKADIGVDLDSQTGKQNWSELDDLYNAIANAIVTIGDQVNQCVNIIKLAELDTKEIAVTINGVAKDLESFTADLIKIKNRYKGKEGLINNPDDHNLSLSIYTDYVTLQERVTGITFTSMLTVTEYFNEAIIKLKKKETENTDAITDASVISDVEFKEA